MARRVGLIRGINVGGARRVGMAALRAFLEELGAGEVQTLLQSGNLVFEGGPRTTSAWEGRLRHESAAHLGLELDFFVRSSADWEALVRENPFPRMAADDPSHLLAVVFHRLPTRKEVDGLAWPGPEEIARGRQAVYATFPGGIGRSRLQAHPGWKAMGAVGTARNWNTVLALRERLRA